METGLIREYRKFRAGDPHLSASHALHMARTLVEWEALESEGVVKIEAAHDEDPYDFGDCLDGMNEREAEKYKEKIYDMGIYGSVGSYLCPNCDEWKEADSVWGHAGYQNVLSPYENYYIPDVMAQTIEAYKAAIAT